MMQVLWLVPVGAIIIYCLWRFVRGTGPRRQQTYEEERQDIQIESGG
jgi:hypothetical protein